MSVPPPWEPTRRELIGGAAVAAAAAGMAGLLPESSASAAPSPMGGLKHVVILMQENRSFDHYYGTMRGVRGFADRSAQRLANGKDVFHQPDAQRVDGGYLLPFHLDTHKVDAQDLGDLPHDWDTTHIAVAAGKNNGWTLAKTEMTMGYFAADDIPLHRALAEAYLICDAYHCSIQGPTTPNRLFHWTGTIDPGGTHGGPATDNPPDYEPAYTWTTYPERLQAAGVSWQVYANTEVGEGNYVGDYGDNPLWLFQAYHDAMSSSDPAVRQLAERASVTPWQPDSGMGKNIDHVLARFKADCAAGSLPQVSWVVAPQAYTEHPAARPVDGQAYVQHVLNAIWGNPSLRDSTAVIINYDENDGFFDHVAPPEPPPGTANEFLPSIQPITSGLPPAFGPPAAIGLGPRVPMLVVSPWSRGGWVNSEVFDHTSVIRFLETWTGVHEPNISAWRRSICGDLTSCFDFSTADLTVPTLPDMDAARSAADALRPTLPAASTPAVGQQVMPAQTAGRAKARALPYQPIANVTASPTSLALSLANAGQRTLQFAAHAYHQGGAVTRFDVAPGAKQSGSIVALAAYDVAIHGPNGFLVEASGTVLSETLETTLALTGAATQPTLTLTLKNTASTAAKVTVTGPGTISVAAGASHALTFNPLLTNHGWYDITVTLANHPAYKRRYAGHLENGHASLTG